MEQTPEEQLMLLSSYIPPHYGLFFRVIFIIFFLFGCKYFLSMADDYITKKLATHASAAKIESIISIYYDAAMRIYQAPERVYPSERSSEHFATFVFDLTNLSILEFVKKSHPNATITCVYDKSIEHLNAIITPPRNNTTGNQSPGNASQDRPNAQFFLQLDANDTKLRYLYGCELKGEHSGVNHDKAAAQMINVVKLQSPTTKYTSIFATIIGTEAQLHSYSLDSGSAQLKEYRLNHLVDFRSFIENLTLLVTDKLDYEYYAHKSGNLGTHFICSNTAETPSYVLKCINSFSSVVPTLRESLVLLKRHQSDFVLKIQTTPFQNHRALTNATPRSDASYLSSYQSSPQFLTNNPCSKDDQSFFSALFTYRPGNVYNYNSDDDKLEALLVKVHNLHKAGFVHNDIRAPNVVCLDTSSKLELIDFGYCLAKAPLQSLLSTNFQDIVRVLFNLKSFSSAVQHLPDLSFLDNNSPSSENLWRLCIMADLFLTAQLAEPVSTLSDAQLYLLENWQDDLKIEQFTLQSRPNNLTVPSKFKPTHMSDSLDSTQPQQELTDEQKKYLSPLSNTCYPSPYNRPQIKCIRVASPDTFLLGMEDQTVYRSTVVDLTQFLDKIIYYNFD